MFYLWTTFKHLKWAVNMSNTTPYNLKTEKNVWKFINGDKTQVKILKEENEA